MPYDVFISHSTKDKLVADAVVAHLEQNGLRCWCAPRDIVPGASWASSIVQGIAASKAMVVVFSTNANTSDHIRREVERAVGHGIPVVPVRIEQVKPEGDLEYFLSSAHWMDALQPPLDQYFDRLAKQLQALLSVTKAAPPLSTAAVPAPIAEAARKGGSHRWIAAAIGVLVIAGIAIWAMQKRAPNGTTVASNDPPPHRGNDSPAIHSPMEVSSLDHSSKDDLSAGSSNANAVSLPVSPPPPPTPVNRTGRSSPASLVSDVAKWEALKKIHWESSFFLDNGPTHYPVWRSAADAGDPTAQFFVGYCYAQGAGVKADDAAAMEWFTKAANAGNTDAMTAIGVRALEGQGGPVDPAKWFLWVKRAADQRDIAATTFLGFGLFVQGEPANQIEGRRLLQQSAAKGSADAEFLVAGTLGLSLADYLVRMQKPADAGQPDAMLIIANTKPEDPASLETGRRAVKMYGNPLALENLIDPPPMFFFNTSGKFTKIAWERLHEMADGGYTTAADTITRLKNKGFKEPAPN
jgi:hypothetical protein